jgi:hypothetical protein
MVNNQPYTTEVNPQAINRLNENYIRVNDKIFQSRIIYKNMRIETVTTQSTNYRYLVTNEPIAVYNVVSPFWYNFKITNKPIEGISFSSEAQLEFLETELPSLTSELLLLETILYPNYFNGELFLIKYDRIDPGFNDYAIVI